jgi:hypothetical protein
MSGRPASGHVQPSGRIEKPGPDVKVSDVTVPVVSVWVVTVSVVDEETVLVYHPGQMYRSIALAGEPAPPPPP